MKKRKKMAALFGAALLLCAYMGLRLWWDQRQPVEVSDIVFVIDGGGAGRELKLWHNYYNNKEYLFLPAFCSPQAGAQIMAGGRREAVWDGNKLGSGEKTGALTDGEHLLQAGNEEFTVVVMHSSKVPALFITTSSGSLTYIEESKGNGEPGLYEMVAADGTVIGAGQIKKLKSRGNATFLEDKKPYQMTLEERADLLGRGEQENYILLANRQDQSLLRDRIMYDMAMEMGLAYSPASTWVDLYVNQEYRGSYQISEKVETGPGRIDIDVETASTQTGFLVTLEYPYEDRLAEAAHYFTTQNDQNVVIKRPSNPTEAQITYISETFQQMEDAIRTGRLEDFPIDLTSFARKYLVEEIGKNLDAMYSSQYFYRDAADTDGKEEMLYAGPVWDYDKTLGNPLIEHTRPVDFQEPRGIFAASLREDASWWYDLYQVPAFRETVVAEYKNTALPVIDEMLNGQIDSYRDEIWDSACMDYMRWDTFEDFKNEEELEFAAEYQAEIDNIKTFLTLRKEFLNDIWLEGRIYDQIIFDPGEGTMYVTRVDAVEGRTLIPPRKPRLEGYVFDHWVREDTGEIYDFTQVYDGVPFTLKAVYQKEEQEKE